MNTFYKSLIVFTAFVALFFFGKWAYQLIPQYKYVESIAQNPDFLVTPLGKFNTFNSGCFAFPDDVVSCFCSDDGTTTLCYTKQKVRTN